MAKAIAKRPQSAAGETVSSRGGPGMAAIFGPPAADSPPGCAADCSQGLFAIAFATALAYGEQPGRCLSDQNKVRQHLMKSAGGGDDTTPISRSH